MLIVIAYAENSEHVEPNMDPILIRRLNPISRPISYELRLTVNLNHYTIVGRLDIRLKVLESTHIIELNAKNLTIDRRSIILEMYNNGYVTGSKNLRDHPDSIIYDNEVVQLHFKELLLPAKYNLFMKYNGEVTVSKKYVEEKGFFVVGGTHNKFGI